MNRESLYKVLIVDDEVLARMGIKSLIKWEDSGFSLVGEADNGENALKIVEDVEPDLIITDIQMPRMNGLELIRKVKESHPHTEFLILSSYDDFSYTREAIQLGARDYLLKLEMSRESLEETLQRVRPHIKRNRKDDASGQDSCRPASVYQDQLLKDLIVNPDADAAGIVDQLKQRGISLPDTQVFCLYLRCLSRGGKVFTPDERSSYNFPIVNLLDEILTDYSDGISCNLRPMEFVIYYAPGISDENPRETAHALKRLVRTVQELLGNYMNLTAVISVSGPEENLIKAAELYKTARGQIDNQFIYPGSFLFPEADFHLESPLFKLEKKRTEAFEYRIKQLDYKGAAQILDHIIGDMPSTCRLEKGIFKEFCYQIANALRSITMECVKDKTQFFRHSIEFLYSLEEYREWISQASEYFADQEGESRAVSSLIERAVRLIQDHFQEELTLTDLAEYLEISSGYLSQRFKQELGTPFSDYLSDIRTSFASRLLLETEESVQHIAKEAGYDNIYYFSRVFKARTGFSPREFRKVHIKKKSDF